MIDSLEKKEIPTNFLLSNLHKEILTEGDPNPEIDKIIEDLISVGNDIKSFKQKNRKEINDNQIKKDRNIVGLVTTSGPKENGDYTGFRCVNETKFKELEKIIFDQCQKLDTIHNNFSKLPATYNIPGLQYGNDETYETKYKGCKKNIPMYEEYCRKAINNLILSCATTYYINSDGSYNFHIWNNENTYEYMFAKKKNGALNNKSFVFSQGLKSGNRKDIGFLEKYFKSFF